MPQRQPVDGRAPGGAGDGRPPRRVARAAHAVRLGLDTRIGLEDTLTLPGGTRAPDNTALVAAATRLIAC